MTTGPVLPIYSYLAFLGDSREERNSYSSTSSVDSAMRSCPLGTERFGRAVLGLRAAKGPRDERPSERIHRQYFGLSTKPNKRHRARKIAAEIMSDVRSPCVSLRRYDANSETWNAGGGDGDGGGTLGGGGGSLG
jgi:hypothetical protein